MSNTTQSTTIAGCYALAAFAIAIISGLVSASPTSQILTNAIIALLLCYFVGYIAGKVFQAITAEYQRSLEASQPQTVESSESPPQHSISGS